MFKSGTSYTKLKTNLRLAINRLKLLEKKKTELAQKARKEIADYIASGKTERAKIRVEHIIREDYLVEAMEVTEMYCDLVLARFGLVQQMKDLDPGLSEAISSLIWCAPRLMTDVPELKVVAEQLSLKYGKPYAMACCEQSVCTISEKLIHKLSVQAAPKVLVEKYLQEIANNYNLEYTPDPQVMQEAEWSTNPLISLEEAAAVGEEGIPQQPFSYPSKAAEAAASAPGVDLNLPSVPGTVPPPPFNYPGAGSGGAPVPPPFHYPGGPSGAPPAAFNYPGSASGGAGAPSVPFNYMGSAAPYHYPPPPPPVEPMPDAQNPSGYPGAYLETGGKAADARSYDDLPGLDNSPPPPYTSVAFSPAKPPTAPMDTSPTKPRGPNSTIFPPDISSTAGGDGGRLSPQAAPRTRFDSPYNAEVPGGNISNEQDLTFNLPELPNVPSANAVTPTAGGSKEQSPDNDEIDFDDLNRRFMELKKK